MSFTGAADRVDASGGFGQGETRPQAFTGLNGKGYLIGRTQDRIIEIADISDPDTSTYVSAVIGNPNSMAAHNGSLYVFIGQDLVRFDTPFSDTDTGTDVFTIDETPRALTSDGTNLYYIHQLSTLNFLYRIDDLDGTPTVTNTGRVGDAINANIRGLVWHDGFFWGVDATTDTLRKIILSTDGSAHNLENVGSYSQFVGPITNPQGFGVVNGVGYISALDNEGSLWELRDFKFTDTIADQSWTVGEAVSIDAPATEDGETPITYAISPALPAGVTLDTSTGGISGTPTATADATDYTLTATDDNGIEAPTTFSASVAASGGVTNNAPSFSESSYSFSDVAIAVNTVVGTVAATDDDDDTLSYSLTGTDASNFAIDSDGEITVATALDNSTTYNFNVVADDQTDTTSVAVTVVAIAAAVTPTLGWEVPSEAVDNTFSATLTSNVALDAAPTVGDLRLRDDDNSDPVVQLNSTNTTITAIAGTNNYLIELELTGTYDDDYTIRINGNTVEYNGAYVNASQLVSAVFSIDSSIGANNAPSFLELSYAFTGVAIAVGTVVGTVAATDADDDTLSYSLTGTDASDFAIDADGEITVATELTHSDTYDFNVVADDQTDTTSVAVTVTATAAPAITFASTIANQSWTVGTPVSLTLPAATGGVGDLTYALSPALPAGVSRTGFDVSGNPTAVFSSATFTYTVTDENSVSETQTFTIVVVAAAVSSPPVWQTGSALEFEIDGGANDTIDVGGLVADADSVEEIYGLEGDWMVYDVDAQELILTDAPLVRDAIEIKMGFRARNDLGVRDAELTITLNGSVFASLHNSLFFKDCVNYETGRVTVRGASTVIAEMTDNDYTTSSTEDDIDIDMSDDSDPTAIDYVFVKYKGTLTSYTFTPTGGTGSALSRTVPTTIDTYEGSAVDMEVNGWKHDLFPLPTRRTATSVRMQFTGTNLDIYALALLEVGVEIQANNAYTSLEWALVDRVGRIDVSPSGRGERVAGSATRWKWEYALTAVLDRESADAFRGWMETNVNCWFAPEFSRDPEQVFPAYFPAVTVQSQYFSDVKGHGDAVSYRVSER